MHQMMRALNTNSVNQCWIHSRHRTTIYGHEDGYKYSAHAAHRNIRTFIHGPYRYWPTHLRLLHSKMGFPLVAIAGGTSQFGRAIVTAFLDGHAYSPIILARKPFITPKWLAALGIEIRRVDYLSVDACYVRTRGVDTVRICFLGEARANVNKLISTLLCKNGTWYTSQRNPLAAGLKNGVKR